MQGWGLTGRGEGCREEAVSSAGRGTGLRDSMVSPRLHPTILSVEGFLPPGQGFRGGGWLGPRASVGALLMACPVCGPGRGASPIPAWGVRPALLAPSRELSVPRDAGAHTCGHVLPHRWCQVPASAGLLGGADAETYIVFNFVMLANVSCFKIKITYIFPK